jgi:preprotein translocase subunit SecA
MEKMLKRFGIQPDESIEHPWFTKAVETAQKKVEQRNFDMRKNVLKFDDVINDQRKAIFEQRIEFMSSEKVDDIIDDMRAQLVDDLVAAYVPAKSYAEQWDIDGLKKELSEVFSRDFPVDDWAKEEGVADTEISERLIEAIDSHYAKHASDLIGTAREMGDADPETFVRGLEKRILLMNLDTNWREHLQTLDHLRSSVGLRAHAQRDPVNEFKTEAFALFEGLLDGLRRDVTQMLMRVRIRGPEQPVPQPRPVKTTETHVNPQTGENEMALATAGAGAVAGAAAGAVAGATAGVGTLRARATAQRIDPNDPTTWGRVPRNSLCPCGSGKKYKHCHGSI